MNISTFLYAKLDKVVKDYQKSKGGDVLHQGLILIIFKHISNHMGFDDTFRWADPNTYLKNSLEGHNDNRSSKMNK